ncbi:ATPase [Antarcticibacterium flavum]|uniref:ATPase n=1 Tax=Antarcticibacterium flavum TaxID=2058175 RepID=A0A5B7WZB3_9FLAO|nr:MULTISPECIES: restriction endonuclease [Antarcticibacterium]MCM4158711.1 ATPase [Antarcticibacterium sp. W02-3]QCY68564.1 ATPase [Antarcticibacterium flavum]
MDKKDFYIIKASGERDLFSMEKVASSLRKAGTDEELIPSILSRVEEQLHEGMTTKEVYRLAFSLLKNKNRLSASRYKLKKAIFELGPTGFPFEKFIAAIFRNSGYKVKTGEVFKGKCVSHEVDVVAEGKRETLLMECKFHGEPGRNCDVKVPLYINSRYQDITALQQEQDLEQVTTSQALVVTNTRFTKDAAAYATCVGLKMLSWDYPPGKGIKDRIDQLGLFPVTVSTLLTAREKQFLLSRDLVLCRDLIDDKLYLDQLEIGQARKQRILKEMESLCKEKIAPTS